MDAIVVGLIAIGVGFCTVVVVRSLLPAWRERRRRRRLQAALGIKLKRRPW